MQQKRRCKMAAREEKESGRRQPEGRHTTWKTCAEKDQKRKKDKAGGEKRREREHRGKGRDKKERKGKKGKTGKRISKARKRREKVTASMLRLNEPPNTLTPLAWVLRWAPVP